jgi:transcriptional regulator with XRE-family HTH domain
MASNSTKRSRKGNGPGVDPEAIALQFGAALRLARGDITQVQLSEPSGIDQATISVIERGLRLPTVEQVARLEHALNLRRGALFEAGYAIAPHSTLDAINNDAALHPLAREVLKRVYAGLLEMPET